ncbi:type I polyketide synthase, partial [Streptomyces sp. SID11233]|nr:type I polyketide synthase [Streptomyces sp. SID11233]
GPPAEPAPTVPAPAPEEREGPAAFPSSGSLAWALSARDGSALRAQARRLADHLAAADRAGNPADPATVASVLAHSRTAFPQRAVVLGADAGELLRGIEALAAGEGTDPSRVVTGRAAAGRRTAFLFTGQ